MSSLSRNSTIKPMSKKKILLSHFALLAVVALFLADRSALAGWIRNFLNLINSGEAERILSHIIAPSKAIYELSHAIGLIYIFRVVLVISMVTILTVFFFVFVTRYDRDIANAQTIKVSEVAENNQFIYKEQQRFLC